MAYHSSSELSLPKTLRGWWRDQVRLNGFFATLRDFILVVWEFALDSLPARRQARYGDVDYDWEHKVDTTGATVHWRDRLLGMFLSAYQPTQPDIFSEIMSSLQISFREFLFFDVGSGKGRVLLMASDYPFRRILGIELLPELHLLALENFKTYKSDLQQSFDVESICADARKFEFLAQPTVLYLFNPLPEAGMEELIANLERSLRERPRPIYVLYHNPILERRLSRSELFKKIGGTHQYAIYSHGY